MKLFKYFILASILSVTSCKKNKDIIVDNNSSVGSSSEAFLSDEHYKKLDIQILYMPGYLPNQNSIENLKDFLFDHLNKPQGINITTKEIPSSTQSVYTLDNLKSIESNHRTFYNDENTLAASIIVVDGKYSSENVLGVAYKNTSMAIFGETINENAGGLNQPSKTKLESTILNHEFGHVLGLVNIGCPMVVDHEATNNSGHCNNENCLMYYAVETTDIASFLIGNDILTIDENCKKDLQGNGGK